jgi:DNA adenine methylase
MAAPILDEGRRLDGRPTLQPFIKWPGGKSSELALIGQLAPPLRGRLIDPFVGGGAVLLAAPSSTPAWANDICPELVGLYRAAASGDAGVRAALVGLGEAWDRLGGLADLYADLAAAYAGGPGHPAAAVVAAHRLTIEDAMAPAGAGIPGGFDATLAHDVELKLGRMRGVERRLGRRLGAEDLAANVEGAVRASFYYAIRARYNRARSADAETPQRVADFFFLREFAYAAMFRFNATGGFNVPYGGMTYNRKRFGSKVEVLYSPAMVARARATVWRTGDFEPFLAEAAPASDDFVFVDPPYDTEFSDYDGRTFGPDDQRRLRDALERLPAAIMVVIKDTALVRALYGDPRWQVRAAPKTYSWTIKSRNDRRASHLVITNYPVPSATSLTTGVGA